MGGGGGGGGKGGGDCKMLLFWWVWLFIVFGLVAYTLFYYITHIIVISSYY